MIPVNTQAQARKDSHIIAIRALDGEIELIQADEIHLCAPTKACIMFWATIVACFVAIGLGTFFMIWEGPESVYFIIGEALLALAVGVLIPGPDFGSMTAPRAIPEADRVNPQQETRSLPIPPRFVNEFPPE